MSGTNRASVRANGEVVNITISCQSDNKICAIQLAMFNSRATVTLSGTFIDLLATIATIPNLFDPSAPTFQSFKRSSHLKENELFFVSDVRNVAVHDNFPRFLSFLVSPDPGLLGYSQQVYRVFFSERDL